MGIETVTIIGAGPSGLAAAIQLKRYGINPLLLEADAVGGLLKNANLVENYPGFPGGIKGTDLVDLFRQQAEETGVRVTFERVITLDHREGRFFIETDQAAYRSKRVVIASGTEARRFMDFEIPGDLAGKVFFEVHLLRDAQEKRIAIVGAGDAAFDYGLNLAGRNDITILNRGSEVKCLPLLWQRAAQKPRITYRHDTHIQRISSIPNSQILLQLSSPAGESSLVIDYLLGAVGRDPCLGYLSGALRERSSQLVEEGTLYFIGDVKNDIYRQTGISVGDGVLAAMQIYRREIEEVV